MEAETGEAHYRTALALAEPRGMGPLVATPRASISATAAANSRRMAMTFWFEGAKAELMAP